MVVAARRLGELTDLLTPNAIRAAVTLGIPALIAAGTDTVPAIAAAAGLDGHALDSLLRHLVAKDILAEPQPGSFTLTAVGELLRSPFAAGQLDVGLSRAHMDQSFAALVDTVRSGGPGYPLVHGIAFWDDLARDPRLAESFDQFMVMWAGIWLGGVAAADVWPDAGTIVDVGGGAGRLIAAVLERRPGLRGIVFEGAGPVAAAQQHFDEHGLSERTATVVGDFFEPWPTGADVYVLCQVLHDWPDDAAAAIVGRAAAVLGDGGRLLVIDRVVDTAHPSESHVHMNLLMHSLFGARERTADQFGALAGAAGLRVEAVQPVGDELAIVTMVPAG
ncbi:MAG: methyltransferase [Ilumatobacteraceae bacterium]